ncbi:MAG: protein-L-isoaspartate(D-aspartate) O-methyltransferase [Salinibacter sp.]
MRVRLSLFFLIAITGGASVGHAQPDSSADAHARHEMVRTQIADRGVSDEDVLSAMRAVPRHRLVPDRLADLAYTDRPLPIGHEQTISQPYIVALMTAAAQPDSTDRVLEVGTGSGYQAAVLAEIVDSVYTIEIVPELARTARTRLDSLGYDNVTVRTGDGYAGWPDRAPFDAIVVTAAPDQIPPPLIDQLAPGGRMVLPVGPTDAVQRLTLVTKNEDGSVTRERLMPVRFVPFQRND